MHYFKILHFLCYLCMAYLTVFIIAQATQPQRPYSEWHYCLQVTYFHINHVTAGKRACNTMVICKYLTTVCLSMDSTQP
jgi:hypothetical protein